MYTSSDTTTKSHCDFNCLTQCVLSWENELERFQFKQVFICYLFQVAHPIEEVQLIMKADSRTGKMLIQSGLDKYLHMHQHFVAGCLRRCQTQ